jgi:hypothetical protein
MRALATSGLRVALACALGAVVACAVAAAAGPPDGRREKSSDPVSTSGPPASLSAAQRAALEAKRAATLTSVRAAEPAPAKGAPISTIPADTGAPSLKPAPAQGPALVAAHDARRAPVTPAVRRAKDEAAIAAFLAAHGPEVARRSGLLKSAAGAGARSETANGRRPAPEERR